MEKAAVKTALQTLNHLTDFTSHNMADVHDKKTRSFNMSRIKNKDTKPELLVRRYLHSQGFRFRLHVNNLPGKPDIVLKKYKTVIFINGCFWHGHENCKYFKLPETRKDWWEKKIKNTKKRDAQKKTELETAGWRVKTLFECELKNENIDSTLNQLKEQLENSLL